MDGIARASGESWPTVMRKLAATEKTVGDLDGRRVRRLGVDEHRFRKVRYVLGTTFEGDPDRAVVDHVHGLETCTIMDIVDGRRGPTVLSWIAKRPREWREWVRIVAMDMSAVFRKAVRKAVREALPDAEVSVDHFHVVALSSRMVTAVRLRRSHQTVGRRGRMTEPSYKHRKLLTCNVESMSSRQQVRLEEIIAADIELGVVYAVKEKVRDLLKTTDLLALGTAWDVLEAAVRATTMPEAKSLLRTLRSWKAELEVFCVSRLTNARSEAANLTAKNMKRIGRGYRNHRNYRLRILISMAGLRPC